MESFTPRGKQPEAVLQDDIVRMLRYHEWVVLPTHGNKYQCGFPDLYCMHHEYGERWVEVKLSMKFTDYQLYYLPKIQRVWVLTGTTTDDYDKLFRPPNLNICTNNTNLPKHKDPHEQWNEEGRRQAEIYAELTEKGYTVMQTYGNAYQKGFPDLYVLKGPRRWWVEIKRINRMTKAQKHYFPLIHAVSPIWVMYDDITIINRPANFPEIKWQ